MATTFTGKVIDENNEPFAFANVVLLNPGDSTYIAGATTGLDGSFSIDCSCQSPVVKFSYIGYETKYINASGTSLGTVQLKPEATMLGEVVVKGTRPTFKLTTEGLKGDDRLAFVCAAETGDDLLMISRQGMGIRFALDTVPEQGRTSAGVRCMALAAGDSVVLAGQLRKSDELLLISDRGNGKRVPAMGFERQNRNGKGVRAFPFAKSGANGAVIAAAILLREPAGEVLILQAQSAPTRIAVSDFPLQSAAGKGMPLVMAVLADVVTDAVLL